MLKCTKAIEVFNFLRDEQFFLGGRLLPPLAKGLGLDDDL